MILDKIKAQYFEAAGTLVGCSASVFILLQILTELNNKSSSTLSPLYVMGFLLIYIFWALYGLKFKRVALWLTNGIAAGLQIVLLVIIIGFK